MWQFLFWASVAAVFYTYIGYPIILLILGLFRRGRHVYRDHEPPSVCLIISAFNEENVRVLADIVSLSTFRRWLGVYCGAI